MLLPSLLLLISIVTADDLQSLGKLVQRRLHHLQNPQNCSRVRKVACVLDDVCGFGCQIHHVVYCLAVGYATQRTFTLAPGSWVYKNHQWSDIFLPLSDTCLSSSGHSHASYPTEDDPQVLHLRRINYMEPRAKYVPLSVPADVGRTVKGLHDSPAAWWVGQLVNYVMRYQPKVRSLVEWAKKRARISSGPIVGVQVRRTDKIREANYQDLQKYMAEAEKFFDGLDKAHGKKLDTKIGKKFRRRIFLATDEPRVLHEARSKYPHYDIVVNGEAVQSAGEANRFSVDGLIGVLVDNHLLSETDYLVCTFSSNLCRLAYEMKMALGNETSKNVVSLDLNYFFSCGNDEQFIQMPEYAGV